MLSGCSSVYDDMPFTHSTTTLQLKVVTEDSKLFNNHKVYLGDGDQELGYINEKSGIRHVASNKPLYITMEYYHAYSKVMKYKSFVLHTQSNTNYLILVELKDQQNYVYIKEAHGSKLVDVDMNRIELY
jgi:hypothetical protein